MQSGTALFRIFAVRRRDDAPYPSTNRLERFGVRVTYQCFAKNPGLRLGVLFARTIIHNFFVLLTTVRGKRLP